MSAPSSSRQSPQGDASLYEIRAIQVLQQRVFQQETEIANLGMSNATLRAEKARLETALSSISSVVQTNDTDLSNMASQLATFQARVTAAEAAARDFKKKYDDSLQTIEELKKAADAQSTKLEQVEMLNANMKAYIERTPAAPRNQQTIGGSSYPQQPNQMESAPSSVVGSFGNPIGYSQSIETRLPGQESALVFRDTSRSSKTRQPVSAASLNQRVLPSFAVAPTPRQVTIRNPNTAVSELLTTDPKGTPLGMTAENKKFVTTFSNVFRAIEKFAKRSVIPLNQNQTQGMSPIPASLAQESNKHLNAATLGNLWLNDKLRYALIVRYVAEDLVDNYWRLSNISSFSGQDGVISRLKEIAGLCDSRQTPSSPEYRAHLISERAKLVDHLNDQLAARNSWIQTSAPDRAMKIFKQLEQALSQGSHILNELTGIYIMAAKVFFFIWGNPYDWHFAFPPGGKSSYWNPASHEAENREIQGKTNAEIKTMDLKVLLSTTPVITQVGYSGKTTVPSCVCLATTLLSRDGTKLDY